MLPVDRESPEMVVLCERRTFLQVLRSPWGLFNLLLAPVTLGFTVLVLAGTYHFATPKRVWLQGRRLFADKSLPAEGVDLGNVRLEIGNQTAAGATANRYVRFLYRNDKGKESFLGLNQIYFGREAIDRVVATFR